MAASTPTATPVLLTNDDGIRAEGIAAMYRALIGEGGFDVRTIAPETVQSATGHGVTLRLPLLTQEVKLADTDATGIAVDGRPADCVKLALSQMIPEAQVVVSGINHGANVGVDVFYSGTVAAAVEGAFLGRRAIAVSLYLDRDRGREQHFDWAATLAMRTIRRLLAAGLPAPGNVVNINLPALADGQEPAGVKVVPQCICTWPDTFERRQDPGGRDYYWNTAQFTLARSQGQTDVVALREGFITVTPLHYDLTDRPRLASLASALGQSG